MVDRSTTLTAKEEAAKQFPSPGAAELGIELVTDKSNRVLFGTVEVFVEVIFSMHSPL